MNKVTYALRENLSPFTPVTYLSQFVIVTVIEDEQKRVFLMVAMKAFKIVFNDLEKAKYQSVSNRFKLKGNAACYKSLQIPGLCQSSADEM